MSLSAGTGAQAKPVPPILAGVVLALAKMRRSKTLGRRLAFLVLGFALIFGYSANSGRTTVSAWSVVFDGQVIATVNDLEEFEQELATALEELQNELGQAVRVGGELTYIPAASDAQALAAVAAVNELRDVLPLLIEAVFVVVDGEPIVACVDQDAAEQAVVSILDAYIANLTKRSGVGILDFGFREQITYESALVCPDEVREVTEAASILERGTDKIVEHQVTKGDTLWGIARTASLSVNDLRLANPQIRGDMIRPGDVLSLVVPDPYLNISSQEQYTYTQRIGFVTQVRTDPSRWPWERVIIQGGRQGQKEVTVLIERVNGQEVSRRLISEQLLSEPVTQIIAQGSKIVPDRGTGQLAWPVVGSITSRFGVIRSGSVHTGVDIAAPTGTPIHAADNGMVSVSQSSMGGYGQVAFIDHGGGSMVTVYAHMSRRAVSVGDVVSKGQVIGYVGSTGRSTGPHLHFEVRINGKPVNPLQYYPSS